MKYGPSIGKDRLEALEELAEMLFEWKRPDETLGMQRRFAEGYKSLGESQPFGNKVPWT